MGHPLFGGRPFPVSHLAGGGELLVKSGFPTPGTKLGILPTTAQNDGGKEELGAGNSPSPLGL